MKALVFISLLVVMAGMALAQSAGPTAGAGPTVFNRASQPFTSPTATPTPVKLEPPGMKK